MKTISKISIFLLTIILLSSCETSYRFTIDGPKKAVLEDQVAISIKEENNNAYEKVLFFVNGKEVAAENGSFNLNTKDLGVGKQSISAMVYYGEGKSKRIRSSIEVFANVPYKAYKFNVVNTFPHDSKAYTQGLEFRDGFLYESTGKRGMSTISKLKLETGEVVKRIQLDDAYFGEGMTILNGKLYSLTWKNRKGFVYNLETFNREKEFPYKRSKEGWGLTNDGKQLIKSDGTNKIWFLDADTQEEKRFIQAYTHKNKIPKLNELEYINGKIYANWWRVDNLSKSSVIVIINPENGVVEGAVDLNPLREEILKTQKLDSDDVLNGIAYDAENDRLFVTGKNWSKIFEIELVEQ